MLRITMFRLQGVSRAFLASNERPGERGRLADLPVTALPALGHRQNDPGPAHKHQTGVV